MTKRIFILTSHDDAGGHFLPLMGETSDSPLIFDEHGMCLYRMVSETPRDAKAGEFYLSGAHVAAYRTNHDMPGKWFIVEPVYHATARTMWVRGKPVAKRDADS